MGEVAGDVGARLKPTIVECRRPEPAGKGGPELQDALGDTLTLRTGPAGGAEGHVQAVTLGEG